MASLNYLELPVVEMDATKRFYADALGWTFTDYGPTYAAAALPVIQVDDLETTLAAVEAAGGAVTCPIFAFPGGRRFHFRDPDGHEMAAMQPG